LTCKNLSINFDNGGDATWLSSWGMSDLDFVSSSVLPAVVDAVLGGGKQSASIYNEGSNGSHAIS